MVWIILYAIISLIVFGMFYEETPLIRLLVGISWPVIALLFSFLWLLHFAGFRIR